MFTDITGKKRLKLGLHTHTTCSDGRKSPEEVLKLYADAGYDALALTDHWVYRPAGEAYGMQILSGCEYNMQGRETPDGIIETFHILGIGMEREPQIPQEYTRVNTSDVPIHQRVREAVAEIRAAGGLAVLAHPAWSLNTVAQIVAAGDYDATEIYNSVSECGMSDRPYSGLVVDMLGAQGIFMPLLATDDAHYYTGEQCRGITMVEADAVEELGVVGALHAGRFYATQGPEVHLQRVDADTVKLRCTPAVKIAFLSDIPWSAGRMVRGEGVTEAEYTIKHNLCERFVRVEVTDANGLTAWSNILEV